MNKNLGVSLLSYLVGIIVVTSIWSLLNFTEPRYLVLAPSPPGFLKILGSQFSSALPGGLPLILVTIPVYGLLFYFLSRRTARSDLFVLVMAGIAGVANCFLLLFAWTTSAAAIQGPHICPATPMDTFVGMAIISACTTGFSYLLGLLVSKLLVRRTMT